MLLHAGHGCGAVVQNNNQGIALVVGHVHQGGDAGVKEGGISNDADHLPFPFVLQGLAHAVGHADAGAHADAGMQTFQRLQIGQCVAADIAVNIRF